MKITTISLILCTVFLAGIVSAQEKTLIYTDHEPLGGMRTRFINDVFFPAIEKESNGRLKIDAHWNGELSVSYGALKTVSGEGIADMAIVVPEYSPNEMPLHQIFKSFPVGPSGQKQIDFFHRVYAEIPAFTDELDNANIVNLLFCTGYPVAFFSTKPLNSLDEIKNGKWRTASFWHRNFLQNAGAIPVTMPWGEGVSKALEDGTLDGLMVNMDSGYEIKAHEVAPNILLSKDLWLGHVYLLVINKNTWNKLGEEDQQAIQRAAATAYKALATVMNSSFDTQIADFEKDGANVRVLTSGEVEQWKNATKYTELQSEWIKEQESKGVKNVDTVMREVSNILFTFN